MKKRSYLLFMAIAMVSILIFSGCNANTKKEESNHKKDKQEMNSDKESEQKEENNETNESASDSMASSDIYTLKDEVLFEDDKCKLVAKDINAEGPIGPELNLYVENKTDKPVTFSTLNTSANGYMLSSVFFADLEPKTNKVGSLSFFLKGLQQANITTLEEIQFALTAYYTGDYNADAILINDVFSVYPTGKTVGELSYIPRTEAATDETVLDEQDVKLVITGLKQDEFTETSLEFYIENNSKKTLNFTGENVVIQGASLDSTASITIDAGKKAYHSMYLSSDELKKNGISDIKEIKFNMKVRVADIFDMSNWMIEPIITKDISYTVK